MTEGLGPLLSRGWESRDEKMAIFASRSEPEAEVQPAADGQLYLTGVKLPAWEGIDLPRQWDDPDREQDEDPYEQLADFVEGVWEAMDEWNRSLVHLARQRKRRPVDVSEARPDPDGAGTLAGGGREPVAFRGQTRNPEESC